MSTRIGVTAEKVAADWLEAKGYKVVARNWRSRTAEIDIIASLGGELVFIESKYRFDTRHGTGLDYLTQQKLRQMLRAAEEYMINNPSDSPYKIAAIALGGKPPSVEEFVESIDFDG